MIARACVWVGGPAGPRACVSPRPAAADISRAAPTPRQDEERLKAHYDKVVAVLAAYYALQAAGVVAGQGESKSNNNAGRSLICAACPATARLTWCAEGKHWRVATSVCDHNHGQTFQEAQLPTFEETEAAAEAISLGNVPIDSLILNRERRGLAYDRGKLKHLLKSHQKSRVKMAGGGTRAFAEKVTKGTGDPTLPARRACCTLDVAALML